MSNDQSSWLERMGEILGVESGTDEGTATPDSETEGAASTGGAVDQEASSSESSWLDSVTDALSDAVSEILPDDPAADVPTETVPADPSADSQEEDPTWWDKAKQTVEDWMDGGEEEEPGEGVEDQADETPGDGDHDEDGEDAREDEPLGFLPTNFTLSVEVICAGTEEVTLTVAPSSVIEGVVPQTQKRTGAGDGKALPTVDFVSLPEGDYTVTVTQDSVTQVATVQSPVGPSSLKFNMASNTIGQYALAVEVISAGQDSVSVTLTPQGGGDTAPQAKTINGGDAGSHLPAVEFSSLSESEYAVQVIQGTESQMVRVKYPGGPSRLTIDLHSGEPAKEEFETTGLNIVLQWATNRNPVGGATINLMSAPSGTPTSVTTDGDGKANVSSLAPELWIVQTITKDGKTYAAPGAVDLADGGFAPLNLFIVPTEEGEDEYQGGPLPTITASIPISVNKEFSYFEVSTVTITGTFKPKKEVERVSNKGFDIELKQELTAKLSGNVELNGTAAISADGLKGSLTAKGKGELLDNVSGTWDVTVTVFNVEKYDGSKKQSGKKFGPLVVTPPTITPQVGLAAQHLDLAVPGTVTITISAAVSPNYEKIAIESGEKLGLRVVAGVGKTAFNIIVNGIYTLYINYKHIIGGLNPDHYKAQAESVARLGEHGFKTGVTGESATFSHAVTSDAYRQGTTTRASIFNELKSNGEIDVHNANEVLDQAVQEAISSGAFNSVHARYRQLGKQAAWEKFLADEPEAMNNNKRAVAAALWGRWNSSDIPPGIRKSYN